MDPDSEGQDFRVRDYYEGAVLPSVSGAYVSRVFRAVTDELFKFGVSARVIRDGQTVASLPRP